MRKRITSDKAIGYAVSLSIFALLLAMLWIPQTFVRWGSAILFGFAAVVAAMLLKKRSIHSFYKKQVILVLTVGVCLFVVLLYVSGLRFGYAKSSVPLSLSSFGLYVIPIVAIIVLSEMVRDVLLAQRNWITVASAFGVGVLSELLIAGGVRYIGSPYVFVDFVGLTLFCAISANVLYQYVSSRFGMMPNVIYRLILTLYPYVISFIPATSKILSSFLRLLLPCALYLFLRLLFEKRKKTKKTKSKTWGYVALGLSAVGLVAFVMILSCQFRFGMIVIASPSMTGEINMGDAVFYESYEYCGEIQENDIIVFSKGGNAKIVHRVIEIETVNGQVRYITKGDANADPDADFVVEEQILGVVRFKVLYIGYPSLWLYQWTKG